MKLFLLILLLTISTVTYGQKLKSSYDKFEDRTNISTSVKGVKGASLDVQGYFNHKGTVKSGPVELVGLVFYSRSREWKYLSEGDRQLFVLADGDRFTLNNASRTSKIESPTYRRYGRSRVTVSERLIFAATSQQLNQMLTAKHLEMRLAGETFSFNDDTRDALRELLSLAR